MITCEFGMIYTDDGIHGLTQHTERNELAVVLRFFRLTKETLWLETINPGATIAAPLRRRSNGRE